MIYAYFIRNIKQLNELFRKKFNNFKCVVKKLELTSKKNSIIFKGLYNTPK